MRVFIDPPTVQSRSLQRIATELITRAPAGVTRVADEREADLVVLHVIGRFDQTLARAARCRDRGQRYVVNQYCLRSTMHPRATEWVPFWEGAALVWSYYDLPQWLREEGQRAKFNFVRSPLGADDTQFVPSPGTEKRFTVGTTGYTPGAECLREVTTAARQGQHTIFHLGVPVPGVEYEKITYQSALSDAELAKRYAQCAYVSALRRIEGFELPAAEAILCGVRPILFDQPHFRDWYDGFGVFVPEVESAQLITHLRRVLQTDPEPLSPHNIAAAAGRFSWARIAETYWSHCYA